MNHQGGLAYRDTSIADLARAGETLFAEGDPCRRTIDIRSGVVRAVNHSCEGHRQIMAFFFPGDVIGLPLSNEHRYTAEAATSLLYSRHPVLPFGNASVQTISDPRGLLLHVWQEEKRFMTRGLILGRVGMLARMSAFLISVIPALHRSVGLFDLPMSQNDIASYLGTSPETVCRTLRQLREMQVIAMPRRGRLAIISSQALELLAEGVEPSAV